MCLHICIVVSNIAFWCLQQVCNEVKKEFNCNIASLAVDNAAAGTGKLICDKLPEKPHRARDAAHTIDLFSKDAAETTVVKSVLEISKAIFKFVRTDRIDGIRLEWIASGLLQEIHVILDYSETRMNNVNDHIKSAILQFEFVMLLKNDSDPKSKWKTYWNERTTAQRASINKFFEEVCTHSNMEKMRMLTSITAIFKRVHQFCSSQRVPSSAFVLAIQAMRNEINAIICLPSFDEVLGLGSAKELSDLFRVRINMDGAPVSGRKVPLLDPHHIHAFLCDPFQHYWRNKLLLKGDLNDHVNAMIDRVISEDDDDGIAKRAALKKDFMVSIYACVS